MTTKMQDGGLTAFYEKSAVVERLTDLLSDSEVRVHVDGMTGSLPAAVIAAMAGRLQTSSLLVMAPDKEAAYYMANDLEALMDDGVLLFPTSYRKAYHYDEGTENANVMQRTEVVQRLSAGERLTVVTWPEALSEKVVGNTTLRRNTVRVVRGEQKDMWELVERLQELGFEREDFVVEPGQYAVRGGIVDVFSFSSELPYRIEFFDDQVDSLRTYDAVSQLSVKQLDRIDIVPDFATGNEERKVESKVSLLEYYSSGDVVWVQSLMLATGRMEHELDEVRKAYAERQADTTHPVLGRLPEPEELCCAPEEFLRRLLQLNIVEYGNSHYFSQAVRVEVTSEPQPTFNKQFDLLETNLREYADRGYRLIITVSNESQEKRLQKILDTPTFNFQLSTYPTASSTIRRSCSAIPTTRYSTDTINIRSRTCVPPTRR